MVDVIVTRNKVIQVDTPQNTRPPNVIVAKQKNIQVGMQQASMVDSTAGAILSNPTMSTRLNRLRDVDSSNLVDGASLIYNAELDKYVVTFVDLKHVKGSFEGGTF